MYYLSFYRMNEIPEATKDRLRDLTFGRENDSPMYAWTYNEGRCWAAILSLCPEDLPTALQSSHQPPSSCEGNPASPSLSHEPTRQIVAWACLTFEVDDLPVVGCYTDPDYRQLGYGIACSEYLLERCGLCPGTPVYAVAENWPAWPSILERFGLEYFEWE